MKPEVKAKTSRLSCSASTELVKAASVSPIVFSLLKLYCDHCYISLPFCWLQVLNATTGRAASAHLAAAVGESESRLAG